MAKSRAEYVEKLIQDRKTHLEAEIMKAVQSIEDPKSLKSIKAMGEELAALKSDTVVKQIGKEVQHKKAS